MTGLSICTTQIGLRLKDDAQKQESKLALIKKWLSLFLVFKCPASYTEQRNSLWQTCRTLKGLDQTFRVIEERCACLLQLMLGYAPSNLTMWQIPTHHILDLLISNT